MELVWEDDPVPEVPFFTRDLYDKYSLAPNIRELWNFLHSPVENSTIKQDCDVGAAKASCLSSVGEAAHFKDNSCISSQVSSQQSCDSDDPCAANAAESTEDCKDTKRSRTKKKQLKSDANAPYPEPRLPFPYMSNLSSKEQKMYVDIVTNKKNRFPPQSLKTRVDNEVMLFMKYLQDVAQICAADYSFISQGAMQYSEDFFEVCLECIKMLPQLYQIHEMTSLTGGTFNPGLALTFEKQLLIMGDVTVTEHKILPADAQLASDYQSVSSENPPAKKAKDMHATISSDGNAEKLCALYEPHVCLTRDALVRLLDNHGPDFREQWELPVWVKVNPGKASIQRKTVYIDSPLLKTEMTVRERSHIYHEESLKLSIMKNNTRNVFHVMTELPTNEQQLSSKSSRRNCVSFENTGLDFDVDLTDLETFGETTDSKTSMIPKIQNETDGCIKSKTATSLPFLSETKEDSGHLVRASSSSHRYINDPVPETPQPIVSEAVVPNTEPMRQDPAQESDQDLPFAGDSDDEKLVIDDSVSPSATTAKQTKPHTTTCSSDPPLTPASESTPVNSESSSPNKVTRGRRQVNRGKVPGDQLGEILRMQTAMFKSASDTAKCPTKSSTRCAEPLVPSHPTSLVKPCVSSYLERNQNGDGETCAAPHESSCHPVSIKTTEHKKILSQDLQASAEDEQDYEAPAEGNLIYKLYSLQELLLMVRSSVLLTHTRRVGNGENQFVPVQVLPKLEYQLTYGVECLTSSEVCQLWTETLLHSSTVPYIAHINAHTSKVARVRKLPDDWKQNICGFKLSKSLNILHHLLKKLSGLGEGQYLIVHKAGEPFVTLLKAANGNASRGAYNLQQVHSSVPQPPTSGSVPWIPVDPAVLLPFHQKHGRVPCTFPPKPLPQESHHPGAGQKNNSDAQGNAKKKKKKRAAKRNRYLKKLIQKSV
ncbi:little elongation complex subunit 2 isoform X1 [Embiotoca jacksoni]|uniref:little elongation complex subunit 2 isoform X1 n=1 Tax=Embiotoca jacksoni TaxID=100190 RepID=UPI003703899F